MSQRAVSPAQNRRSRRRRGRVAAGADRARCRRARAAAGLSGGARGLDRRRAGRRSRPRVRRGRVRLERGMLAPNGVVVYVMRAVALRPPRQSVPGRDASSVRRQPPPLRAAGLGRRALRDGRGPGLVAADRARARLARRPRAGLSARVRATERHAARPSVHGAQPRVSGRVSGCASSASSAAARFLRAMASSSTGRCRF